MLRCRDASWWHTGFVSTYLAPATMAASNTKQLYSLLSMLTSPSPIKNPGLRIALRSIRRRQRSVDKLLGRGPGLCSRRILCDSIPKSGTNLLMQVLHSFPGVVSYDTSIATRRMIRLRHLDQRFLRQEILRLAPGECALAHLEFDEQLASFLQQNEVLHFFIIRDPRDQLVSEMHYLSRMAPWHRMHRELRKMDSDAKRIDALIDGVFVDGQELYPSTAQKLSSYAKWLQRTDVCVVRFESMLGEHREHEIHKIVNYYCDSAELPASYDREKLIANGLKSIDPAKSRTFRNGRTGEWRTTLSKDQVDRIHHTAGDVIQRMGYSLADDGVAQL